MENKTLTREEKIQQGKALREKCPRSKHAVWSTSLRTCDPIQLLEESNMDRIPGLVGIRYQRMSESPFKFFRGSSVIQASDLANSPASSITIQVCGDCHLLNFGGFATPERSLVFDINDFDETFPGPWEWDIKRLAVSFVLAARELGFSKDNVEDAARQVTFSYRTRMLEFTQMSILDRWYEKITVEKLEDYFKKDKDAEIRLKKAEVRAISRTSETLFPKLTSGVKGHPRIKDEPPLLYHYYKDIKNVEGFGKYANAYKTSLQEDRRILLDRYQVEDISIKVVGIGSVGTRCIVVLLYADGSEPLFLQIKEARRSVLENPDGKSRYEHQGYRIVHGQRLMQSASDIFLGWFRSDSGHDYYVRQLHDMKVTLNMENVRKPRLLSDYAEMCGWALARAHSKAGDASRISGYLGSKENFDDALVQYSTAYADQVEKDFKVFKAAIQSGKFKTKSDKEELLEFYI
ncbi:MAG: DUF2252 domain-containing protein [Thaumarchaeota archaeon]|nr:DUF2252 domain-containing protein [Nitrososphaerota archaeon]